jgi:hypothetical protein
VLHGNFFLFSIPETALEGRRFNDVTMIQAKSQDALVEFQTTDLRKCFKRWHNHWPQCVKSRGNNVDGDTIDQKESVVIMEI